MLISNSFYPHITLPTRFSNNNGTLIDNLNNVQLKDKPPKYITIRIQSQQAISNFVHDITSSDVNNKLNQSPNADPNVTYNMLCPGDITNWLRRVKTQPLS